MRYPNLRYGNPNELAHYMQGRSIKDVAKSLRRSERSLRDWLSGAQKIPWWIPEIMRLQRMEFLEQMRQMNMGPVRLKLGLVTGEVIALQHPIPKTPSVLRLDDFDRSKAKPESITAKRA